MIDNVSCRCGRMEVKGGEVCPSCGHTKPQIAIYYYMSKSSPGKWKRCHDEGHCMQMARIGYEVKKVVV